MKFRRRSREEAPPDEAVAEEPAVQEAVEQSGPRDSRDVAGDGVERLDLGGLLLSPLDDREIRLQVDEASGQVQAVLVVGSDGAVDLRAYAAPRGGDLWSEVRSSLTAEASQHGGTVDERAGRHGTELVIRIPATGPQGESGVQISRVVGVNGERWLLRATYLGRPAAEPDRAEDWDDVLDHVVVHRGQHAMPVGDALPLTLPPDAQPHG